MSYIFETTDYAVQVSANGEAYEVIRKDSGIVQASEPVLSVNLYNCVNMQKVMGMFLCDEEAVGMKVSDTLGVLSPEALKEKKAAEEARQVASAEDSVAQFPSNTIREV